MTGLSPYALDILALLEHDLEECGPGVPAAEVATKASSRWPHGPIRQLRAAGYLIEEINGRFRLYETPASSESSTTSGGDRHGSSPAGARVAPVDGSLDVGQLGLNGERAA